MLPALPSDPESARLEDSCLAALSGGSISALNTADDLVLITALQLEVEHCAATYCAAPNTLTDTMDECVLFIIDQFGFLCPSEIRQAFRLAAAGKIEANLNAYNGAFSVRILGEVLSAYEDYRTLTFRKVRSQISDSEDPNRSAVLKQVFGGFEDQLARVMKSNPYGTWQEIPAAFARAVVERSLINFSLEEKGQAWRRAKSIAAGRVPQKILDAKTQFERNKWVQVRDQMQADPELFHGELKPEATIIYAQILLWEKLPAK